VADTRQTRGIRRIETETNKFGRQVLGVAKLVVGRPGPTLLA
jgi:hypothetical protein